VIFSPCHSLVDIQDWINVPVVYTTGCRITVLADQWPDVQVHSKDSRRRDPCEEETAYS